ncbi:MAG TPA: hypothetical protein VK582_00345 [Pyrinomonadaceae bacterium]|nr:hypothetical protein [Pyrinomonadaceae bacterium]
MKRKLLYLAFFAAFVATSPATLQSQYLHPKVSGKETVIRNVVLMPAKVEIVKQSMKGPEGMAAESDLLSTRVSQLITEALAAKHVNVSSSAAAGETDAQKTYVLSDVQARYDALLPKIMKKPKDVKKGRFTLGDEVLNLNLAKTTDAIVFVRGQGQKLTKGKSAFSILTLSLNFPYLMLTIGIVDAHTGDVLVFATLIAIADATSQNEKPLRKAIEKSLKKLPLAP